MLKFIAQLIFVLLTLSAGVINIFVNISAISTDLVPSALKYITVDTSLLGQSLSSQNAELDSLYTTNSDDPLGQGLGVRQDYYFGQYAYCGTLEGRRDGVCLLGRDSGSEFISRLDPYTYIINDTPENLKDGVRSLLEAPDTTFTASDYLRRYSAAAYWLIFLSAIFTGVALFTGVVPTRYTFFFGGVFCLLAFLTVAVGAAILTALIAKIRHINGEALGVYVHFGVSLWLVWITAFVLMIATPFYFLA
ncbi:hypothetical protein WALSEDRAFT_17351 [Wallemia mellicola CBS 633.66]|uniref:Actin cortical patch SUR7/pH-response regulator PalI n=1 Tax=Wallemia mellicola (strain ATCC MYA-4683 / CBS 633.66) TaxID=671144 RepID=I4YEK7_WALMC|nr:hypothetical protein WALSEDRAFT_17351 [Wallemia mellicola CBS 633.66]EIM22399.1 hypothetical protein WALSEDRAFT_17351 [Wallemia mellicola CBS 633.66]|eukprot:XP_006957484.1 hypothetical protein WALSEDRAFT_17351 [Wallemia mellicola CBS 633.66]